MIPVLSSLFKSRFPDFWDLFSATKKNIFLLIILSLLLVTAFCLALISFVEILTHAQQFQLERKTLYTLQRENLFIFGLSFLSITLFLLEVFEQIRTTTRRLHEDFLVRFCRAVEDRFGGDISEVETGERLQGLLTQSANVFKPWGLLGSALLALCCFVFLIGIPLIGNFFAISGAALVISSCVFFVFGLMLVTRIFWLRPKFARFMEEFQETYRDLSIETKYQFHLPCGNVKIPSLDESNRSNSYFQFFELGQSFLGRTVFKNFSFTLPTQKTISVCAQEDYQEKVFHDLLFRWIDPELGQLRICKSDLRNYERVVRRKHIRAARHSNFLLPLSLFHNLSIYCDKEPSERSALAAIEFADLNHLITKRGKATTAQYFGSLSPLDRFRILIARLYLLTETQVFYLYKPFHGLSSDEKLVAAELAKKLARERQIVFFIPESRDDDPLADYVFFFPTEKNPVLSVPNELKARQAGYKNWTSAENSSRSIEIQFETNAGKNLSLRWKLLPGKLSTLWWTHLWNTLSADNIGFEQRFFGWRTEEKHQERRASLLNVAIGNINSYFSGRYHIPQLAHPNMNQDELNQLHHHFENLMGQSWRPSAFLRDIPSRVHNSIRALNDLVHDFEYSARVANPPHGHRVVSGFQFRTIPFHQLPIPEECFSEFTFENRAGDLVTDYCQLGKTWSEVCEDSDNHIKIENISPLRYFSSSFICNFHDLPFREAEKLKSKVIGFIEKKQISGWNVDPFNLKNALGHIALARLEPQKENSVPSLAEFSTIAQIRSISLKDGGRVLSKELPNFTPYYEEIEND